MIDTTRGTHLAFHDAYRNTMDAFDTDEANWPIMQERFDLVIVSLVQPQFDTSDNVIAEDYDVERAGQTWTLLQAITHVQTQTQNPQIPLDRPRRLKYKHPVANQWVALTADTSRQSVGDTPKIAVCFVAQDLFEPSRFFNEARGTLIRPTGFQFRIPQAGSLVKMHKNLMHADAGTRFMVVMPTGTGKTTVIALSPFLIKAQKTLVVCPNLELTQQVIDSISKIYSSHHPLGRHLLQQGLGAPTIQRYEVNSGVPENADIIVTNIQALTEKSRGSEVTMLRDEAKGLLGREFHPELIIFDEAHHSLANSWTLLQAEFRDGSRWKYLLLTATPMRADGLKYGLEVRGYGKFDFLYIFKRDDAVHRDNGYIKQTTFKGICPPDAVGITKLSPSDYTNEEYMQALLVPAAEQLKAMRERLLGFIPSKMLVHVRTNKDADITADFFNKLSLERGWGLHAAAIHGTSRDNVNTKKAFKFPSREEHLKPGGPPPPGGRVVDVGVQCMQLGEGYDNPWISVSVFLAPAKSVSKLSQYHGRAIRTYDKQLYDETFGGAPRPAEDAIRTAYLFYPMVQDVKDVVQQYRDSKDEDMEAIFAQDPELSDGPEPSDGEEQVHVHPPPSEATMAAAEEEATIALMMATADPLPIGPGEWQGEGEDNDAVENIASQLESTSV